MVIPLWPVRQSARLYFGVDPWFMSCFTHCSLSWPSEAHLLTWLVFIFEAKGLRGISSLMRPLFACLLSFYMVPLGTFAAILGPCKFSPWFHEPLGLGTPIFNSQLSEKPPSFANQANLIRCHIWAWHWEIILKQINYWTPCLSWIFVYQLTKNFVRWAEGVNYSVERAEYRYLQSLVWGK